MGNKNTIFYILKNLSFGVISLLFILFIVFKVNKGYEWVSSTLYKNFVFIINNSNLDDRDKMKAKFGSI